MRPESSLDRLLEELGRANKAALNEQGLLEVDESAVGELVVEAAKAGRRIEVLGTQDSMVVVRPSRRLERFSLKGSSLEWKNAGDLKMVMLD